MANIIEYRSDTMQNGKIVSVTDKIITLELKYNFYGTLECSKFINHSQGYLCLYNFETGQIFSVPTKLRTIGENMHDAINNKFNSNTSVYIDIPKNKISDMEIDLLNNSTIFGFCLTKNTYSLILSELKQLLTVKLQSYYARIPEDSLYFFLLCASSFIILFLYALTKIIQILLFGPIYSITIIMVIYLIKIKTSISVKDEVDMIIDYNQIGKKLPLFKKIIFKNKMKIFLNRMFHAAE